MMNVQMCFSHQEHLLWKVYTVICCSPIFLYIYCVSDSYSNYFYLIFLYRCIVIYSHYIIVICFRILERWCHVFFHCYHMWLDKFSIEHSVSSFRFQLSSFMVRRIKDWATHLVMTWARSQHLRQLNLLEPNTQPTLISHFFSIPYYTTSLSRFIFTGLKHNH